MEIKNSFLAEAIDRLTDLGKKTTEPTTILANGRTFLVTGTSCEEIDPIEKPHARQGHHRQPERSGGAAPQRGR